MVLAGSWQQVAWRCKPQRVRGQSSILHESAHRRLCVLCRGLAEARTDGRQERAGKGCVWWCENQPTRSTSDSDWSRRRDMHSQTGLDTHRRPRLRWVSPTSVGQQNGV